MIPDFEHPQFAESADGTAIAYYDHGGDGPDLILGHASGFCAAVWSDVVDLLTEQFRCVTYDTRGHGRSRVTQDQSLNRSETFDWERLADDLDTVIDAADLDRPFGIGHSSGGAAQILLSERGDYLRAMYLFEPVVFDFDPPRGPSPDRELASRTRRRRKQFDSRDQVFLTFRERGPFVNLTHDALNAYVNFGFKPAEQTSGDASNSTNASGSKSSGGPVELILDPLDEAEIYSLATDHFGYQRLGQITCPTVIAHGSTSSSFSSEQMSHVADKIKDGQLATFEGVGHFAPLERPAQFAAAASEFFLNVAVAR